MAAESRSLRRYDERASQAAFSRRPTPPPGTRSHVHMINHQMPFLDPAFLPRRKPLENFSKVLPQLAVKRLPAAFRDEHDMVLQSHFV